MADWQSLDPEAAREAEKYENPIPSRELILARLDERGAPASREQLVDEYRERGARPRGQHDRGDQRDALLPDGADPQESNMTMRANEDFMVLKQRVEALAPVAQARGFR